MNSADGRIVTFYSYKGGTGRSMALANFAWLLATNGHRVLAIDWDLEAPGLHRYFRPFLVDPDLSETNGIIDAFWNITAEAWQAHGSDNSLASHLVADALDDVSRRLTGQRLNYKFFPENAWIDFIGAGRQDGGYSERVTTFDWKRFYEIGGATLLSGAKNHLRKQYDWVLIDSRTGVSDSSGICTIQLPDVVVACFTLNRQSIDGVTSILRSIRSFRSPTVDGSAIEFFPLATRIENAEQMRLEVARTYARKMLENFLPKTMQSRPRDYWDKMEISYRPAYAFEEILAAFGDATGAAGASDTMLSQVEATSRCITNNDRLQSSEIEETARAEVLAQTTFAVSLISTQQVNTRDESDTEFLRNIRAKEQLWRTNGYFWRRLLSRREIDLLTDEDRKGFGRNMSFYVAQSDRMQSLLRTTDIASPGIFLLAVLIGVSVFLLRMANLSSYSFTSTRDYIAFSGFLTFGFVWIFLVLLTSVIAFRNKPNGLRISELLLFLFIGPLRPDIRDYDSKKKPLERKS